VIKIDHFAHYKFGFGSDSKDATLAST
jgi:hypothetical protein